jgi:hypothetical protein
MGCHTSVDESEKPGQQEEEIRKRKGRAGGRQDVIKQRKNSMKKQKETQSRVKRTDRAGNRKQTYRYADNIAEKHADVSL